MRPRDLGTLSAPGLGALAIEPSGNRCTISTQTVWPPQGLVRLTAKFLENSNFGCVKALSVTPVFLALHHARGWVDAPLGSKDPAAAGSSLTLYSDPRRPPRDSIPSGR